MSKQNPVSMLLFGASLFVLGALTALAASAWSSQSDGRGRLRSLESMRSAALDFISKMSATASSMRDDIVESVDSSSQAS